MLVVSTCADDMFGVILVNCDIFCCTDESVLLDLKHLLIEAKQKVPEFLAKLQSENEQYLNIGGNSYTSVCPVLLVFA